MMFEFSLPDKNTVKTHNSENNSVILIGANGSGKSKLGAWIEKSNPSGVHRVTAQRNLNFDAHVKLMSYDQASRFVMYGTDQTRAIGTKHMRFGSNDSYTTTLINDYNYVLAALFAKHSEAAELFMKECKMAESQNAENPKVPITVVDQLITIWDSIFPHRNLVIEKSAVNAVSPKNGESVQYSATEMSDGERSVLYLAAQVLTVPANMTIVIDEPELHLHPSIMNKLWVSLEQCRQDCLFIYITHDTQFASNHSHSMKFWLKSYDGTHWDIEKIKASNLPDSLLFEILGARNNVIFVEGEESSFDIQLYSLLYPDYHIVPCGSCSQVITRTKAFKNSENLHQLKVYGLIDRDFRSENEIGKLKSDQVHTLEVAEIENLLLIEELLNFMNEYLNLKNDAVEKVKEFVIQTKFKNQITQQINLNLIAEVEYNLSIIDIESVEKEKVLDSVEKHLNKSVFDSAYNSISEKYHKALQTKDYKEILKIFNNKGIVKAIGKFFNLQNNAYGITVISLLLKKENRHILDQIRVYLPEGIPSALSEDKSDLKNVSSF